jgi:outer membrane protein assembly factor BamE (lipoprotein component of BamABCDE complex)
MKFRSFTCIAASALGLVVMTAAHSADGWSYKPDPDSIPPKTLAMVKPGKTTKTQVKSLLGEPWRIVQFNDCGMSMPGQADETWDYRGRDSKGTYRVHIEFDDRGTTSVVARIPDRVESGVGTPARTAPVVSTMAMKM